MTQKSPEEYFRHQNFGASDSGSGFTPAERAFMQKYLGLEGNDDVLRKIGITPPSPPASGPAEMPAPLLETNDSVVSIIDAKPSPPPPAEKDAEIPVASLEPEPDAGAEPEAAALLVDPDLIAAAEAEADAEKTAAEEEALPATPEAGAAPETVAPEAALEPAPEPEISTADAPVSDPDPAPQALPVPEPASAAAPAPEPEPLPEPDPAPVAAPGPIPAAVAATAKPSEVFEPEEPSIDSMMRLAEEQQLVAFYLGEQEFVLPIIAVQEVIRALPFARIPSAPALVAGVVNLRGRVTPLLQLRELLDVPRKGDSRDDSFIIVCRHRGIQMGLLIDRVHTMYRVRQKDVDWQVEATLGNIDIVSGLLKNNDRLLGIISIDKIFDMLLQA